MPRLCLLISLLTVILCSWAYASGFESKLDEAESYLTVNPARTLTLLENMPSPPQLAPDDFIRGHILLLRAAVPTNQMDTLIQSLDALFPHHQHPYFQQHLTAITSALGIWLRRNSYLHDAQLSLECTYKYTSTDTQRINLTNSLALVARQLNDNEKARNLLHKARLSAEQSGQINVQAMVENNLGLLALDEDNVKDAEPYLRASLAGYQSISQRAGQISAGINLLFYFLIQEELHNFQRLYSPTANLTSHFPNQAKQALLFWLETRYQQMTGQQITEQTRQKLYETYHELEDDKVSILVHRYLATHLGVQVKLPEPVPRKAFDRSWFSLVKQCNWPLSNHPDGTNLP